MKRMSGDNRERMSLNLTTESPGIPGTGKNGASAPGTWLSLVPVPGHTNQETALVHRAAPILPPDQREGHAKL